MHSLVTGRFRPRDSTYLAVALAIESFRLGLADVSIDGAVKLPLGVEETIGVELEIAGPVFGNPLVQIEAKEAGETVDMQLDVAVDELDVKLLTELLIEPITAILHQLIGGILTGGLRSSIVDVLKQLFLARLLALGATLDGFHFTLHLRYNIKVKDCRSLLF